MLRQWHPVLLSLLLLILASLPAYVSSEERILSLQSHELHAQHFPAPGEYLALWIASGNGFDPRHRQVAAELQQLGIESWQVDLLENLFLPRGSGSIRKLNGSLVADLVQQLAQNNDKRILLVGNSYGAIPVIRGMRQWQLKYPSSRYLLGAVLFSPNTYQGIPSLGLAPEYIPEVRASNMPIMILQSARHGNRWQLPHLLDALRQGGSPVFVRIMPGATSLFYKEDRAEATLSHLQKAAGRIASTAHLFNKLPLPVSAAPWHEDTPKAPSLGLDIQLKPFRGGWSPPALSLKDANGKQHELRDYTGKVRVINFWATWCPPCVEEIPSLNRLREQLADEPFELISVNYAQQPEEVKAFLRQVEVNFPVLIDRQGTEAARWRVIAFPSTFVIDARGKIRYGVNAAIEWDSPQVITTLRRLIQESR